MTPIELRTMPKSPANVMCRAWGWALVLFLIAVGLVTGVIRIARADTGPIAEISAEK
jgi:hypothetical protein